MDLTLNVQPACLSPTLNFEIGKKCEISGWGSSDKKGESVLKSGEVEIQKPSKVYYIPITYRL